MLIRYTSRRMQFEGNGTYQPELMQPQQNYLGQDGPIYDAPQPPVVITGSRIATSDQMGSQNGMTPGESSALPWWVPQNVGSAAVTGWDSAQRANYSKQIKQAAQQALQKIPYAWLANDVGRATDAAWAASETRNAVRDATRQKLSWGGLQTSKALDKTLPVAEYFDKYRSKSPDPFSLAETVATKAGSSNRVVSGMTTLGKVMGPVGVGFGAYSATTAVMNAPQDQRIYVGSKEVGGIVGGAAFGIAATGLAVLALGSNPIGWVVMGVGLTAGVAGGFGGNWLGRQAGGNVYQMITGYKGGAQ